MRNDTKQALFHVSITKCKNYNLIGDSLLRLLTLLGLNSENPLAEFINSGDTVILKPNWIKEHHQYDPNEWESVITHPHLIKAVLKLVLLALKGKGKVIVADGPQTDSSFSKILERMNADEWIKMGRENGVKVELIDLREDEWVSKGEIIVERRKLPGDPKGSVVVDLKNKSAFAGKPVPPLGYYGADYKSSETTWAHSEGRNLYKVSRSVIEGDVFINLPKLKTHRKAGITVCMKNLVGINTYRNYLPHHAEGTPEQGGDQFPSHSTKVIMERAIVSRLKKLWARYPSITKFFIPAKAIGRKIFGDNSQIIRSGSWYGNDTLWRTIVDLNRILLYVNPDGTLRKGGLIQAKRYLAIVDGIVAGEGDGPVAPNKVNAGILIAGFNPLAVDCVAARIMGFDYRKIHYLREAFNIVDYPIADFDYDDIRVLSDYEPWNRLLKDIPYESVFKFRPPSGWIGHIELDEE